MALLTYQFLLNLIGILIAIVFTAYLYVKHVSYNYWKNKGIPQAEPIVPFGSMWPIVTSQESIGTTMRDLYIQFKGSPVFGFYSFHKPTLVICDFDLVRFILTKEFATFQNRGTYINEKADPLSGHLFSLPSERWKNMRVKFTPTFTSGKMKYMFAKVKECSDNLAQCVVTEMKEKNFVEIKDLMARYSTDVIASVAFGVECNSLENPDAEFRVWGRKFMEPKPIFITMQMLCPSLLNLFDVTSVDKDVSNFIMSMFKDTVEYRTANKVVRKDFLDLVMQLMSKGYVHDDNGKEPLNKPESEAGKITMHEGAAQVFIFWLAGFETSSSAATHCLYELAMYQDIQEKLADEINQVMQEFGDLTYESLNAMPYLHKVVSEALRKYPSLPTLNRECNKDIELPSTGIRISKGTQIVIPVWGFHSDPDIFPEPDKFDPERFSDENIASRHRYSYLPFGEGPRNCIGLRFGLMQMKIGLVTLLAKYRFHLTPATQVPVNIDKGNFLLCPKDGVPLRVEQRYSEDDDDLNFSRKDKRDRDKNHLGANEGRI